MPLNPLPKRADQFRMGRPPTRTLLRGVWLAAMVLGVLARRSDASPHDECASCHRATVAAAAPSAGDSIVAACNSCHPGNGTSHAMHDGDCLTCHDPHGSSAPFQLRQDRIADSGADARFDPETRLCVSCHFEAGTFRGFGGGFVRHPVGIPVPAHDEHVLAAEVLVSATAPAGGMRPIVLPLATAGAGGRDVIGCGTCHAMHHNDAPDHLRWTREQEVAACTSCHRETSESFASR